MFIDVITPIWWKPAIWIFIKTTVTWHVATSLECFQLSGELIRRAPFGRGNGRWLAQLFSLVNHDIYIYRYWGGFHKWGVPLGVPLVIIHFRLGFSLINHPAIGVPPFVPIYVPGSGSPPPPPTHGHGTLVIVASSNPPSPCGVGWCGVGSS